MSHYRLLEELGRGGMGVVYLAEDTRLRRFVALKFLPENLASDPVAMARFQREARSASSLNHPNICTIHDFGKHQGRSFIAMELLEGETLRDRLLRQPLSLDEILDLGIEIADALGAAHAKRIIHRDIKPSNIFVTKLHHAKVTDFGLAKLSQRDQASTAGTPPTIATEPDEELLTSPGFAVGTVGYMSPEQARGEPLDGRTDLFSFGAVLYEMGCGRRAFTGETMAMTLEAILNREPTPLLTQNPQLPTQLDAIVSKALEKDHALRYQTAANMGSDLKRLKRDLEVTRVRGSHRDPAGAVPERTHRRSSRPFWVGAAALILALTTAVLMRLTGHSVLAIPATWTQITFSGNADEAALSPDGKSVAYALVERNRPSRLMVQDVGGGHAVEIGQAGEVESGSLRWVGAGNALLATWKNDSTWMTCLLPRMGGAPQPLTTVHARELTQEQAEALPLVGALSPDGATLAGGAPPGKRITLRSVTGTDSVSIPLKANFDWFQDLDWAPDGEMLVVSLQEATRWSLRTLKRDGTRQQKVYEDSAALWCPRWAPDGAGIYCIRAVARKGALLKVYLSANGGPSRKRPRVLLTEPELEGPIAVSRDGRRLSCVRAINYSNVWLWPRGVRDGTLDPAPRQLTLGTASIGDVRLSPDGHWVAYLKDESGVQDVHVLSLSGGTDRRLTFLGRDARSLAWSPDGKSIAFTAPDGDTLRVWIVPAAGGKPIAFRRSLASGSFGELAWAPGRDILYQTDENRGLKILDPATGSERYPLPSDFEGWKFCPAWSPDQEHFVFTRYQPPLALWVGSNLVPSPRHLADGPLLPWVWEPQGRGVLAWAARAIVRISYPAGDTAIASRVPPGAMGPDRNSRHPIDFSSDLRSIVYKVSERKSDVWLVENFDPDVR